MAKAYIVVEVDNEDVAPVRRAIHALGVRRDAVFREHSSQYNFGVHLYPVLRAGMDDLFRQVRRISSNSSESLDTEGSARDD